MKDLPSRHVVERVPSRNCTTPKDHKDPNDYCFSECCLGLLKWADSRLVGSGMTSTNKIGKRLRSKHLEPRHPSCKKRCESLSHSSTDPLIIPTSFAKIILIASRCICRGLFVRPISGTCLLEVPILGGNLLLEPTFPGAFFAARWLSNKAQKGTNPEMRFNGFSPALCI